MAEGFEPYHVPQQSRRDKLRVVGVDNHLQGCAGLLPLYDPSLISPDLLTYATLHNPHHNQTSYQDLNNNPFFYAPQNLNNHHHSFNIGGSENQHNTLTTTQGLSLSLSSSGHHNNNMYGGGDDKVTVGYVGGGSTTSDISRNYNNNMLPLGPFVGYGTILKESRFLKPAEQLLEGICDVGCGIYAEKITSDSPLIDPPPLDVLSRSGIVDDPRTSRDGGDDRSKKSRLISMLDEVYRRYKQYYQQVQAVVASFETVPGLSNAAPYAHLALKAMNKHFGYLKNAITDQLQFMAKSQGQLISYGNDETPRSVNSDKVIYGRQRQIHNNLGFNEHQPPVWRPQRGLPERAVTVLRAWLFEHFLHPYPTDTDKLMLAKQTGLSRNQVSNWFINARVRLWKPMVEEIHTLETREAHKNLQREDQNANSRINDHFPQSTSLVAENPSTSTQIVQDLPLKRTRNVFLNNPMGVEEPVNLMYNNSLHHQEMGVGSSSIGGGYGGVSLTLGLHQNNGVVFSEPFPINAARRLGLDSSSEGFVMGSFEGQNRQIGRNYVGGQLLHDFVG